MSQDRTLFVTAFSLREAAESGGAERFIEELDRSLTGMDRGALWMLAIACLTRLKRLEEGATA